MIHEEDTTGGYLNSIWYHSLYNRHIDHGFEHLFARWYIRFSDEFDGTGSKIAGFMVKRSDMSGFWDGNLGAGYRPDGQEQGGGFRIVTGHDVGPDDVGEARFYTYHTEQMLDRWSQDGELKCKYYGDATAPPAQYVDTPGDVNGQGNYYCSWDRGSEYASAMGARDYDEYTDIERHLQKETWYCIEAEMILNTPGENDATIRYWIDDELAGEWPGLKFREHSDMAIHAFQLTGSSGKSHPLQHTYFDNIVVSTERIRCYDPDPCAAADVLCVDDTPGDTQEYSNIQSALEFAGAGDTVLIHDGTYTPSTTLQVRSSGTAESPLTIKGLSMPVIDGSSLSGDILNVEFHDNIIIEGLEVTNAGRSGIRLTHSDNSIVRNNHAHHNYRWGIFTSFSDDLLIEDNECSYSEDEHGIYVSNSGDRPIIRGNRVHHNNANGIHMNGDIEMDSDTYHDVDGVISEALVENNIVYSNGAAGGSAINCDGVRDSTIQNNLIYYQHSSGISLYQINGGQRSENNRVFHNTIIIADDGRWAVNLKDGSCANTVKNNILLTEHSSHGSIAMDCTTGLDSDYNIMTTNNNVVTPDDDASYYSLQEWQNLGFDTHSVTAEIIDVFEAFGIDFRPKEESPAVDTSFDIGVNIDMGGNSRPNGNGFDIGAIESGYSLIIEACDEADTDDPLGEISLSEINDYISLWFSGSVGLEQVIDAIGKWKDGCS